MSVSRIAKDEKIKGMFESDYNRIPLVLKRGGKKGDNKEGNGDDDGAGGTKTPFEKLSELLKNLVLVLAKPWWNLFILISLVVKIQTIYMRFHTLT